MFYLLYGTEMIKIIHLYRKPTFFPLYFKLTLVRVSSPAGTLVISKLYYSIDNFRKEKNHFQFLVI